MNKIIRAFIIAIFGLAIPHKVLSETVPLHSNLNTVACPKTEYQYWVDTKPNYGKYEWKITGGSFIRFGQKVTEIFDFGVNSVSVAWNNVPYKEGATPKGTITLKIRNLNNES